MPSVSPKSRTRKKELILVVLCAVMFIGSASFLFMNGMRDAQHQYRVNSTYLPVDAAVLSATVEKHTESKGPTHFVPNITYRYEVDGKRYQSDRFRATEAWGNEDWANSIIARYPVGHPCHAFYDPANPSEAVLSKGYSFGPYFDSLEAVLFLAFGVFITLSSWFERKREPVVADNGWFEIAPKFTERARLRVAGAASLVWYGFGAMVAAHYFYSMPAPHPSRSVHFFEGFAALGLIPLLFLFRYARIARNLGDAQLLLSEANPAPGKEFKFTLSQQPRRPLALASAQVSLRCVGIKVRGKRRDRTLLHEENPAELQNHTLHLGESLDFTGSLTIQPGLPPSGRDASGKFTWIEWEMALRCNIGGAPGYNISFPLNVQPASIEAAQATSDPVQPRGEARVQQIDPNLVAGALTRRNIALLYLIGLFPIWSMLLGIALIAAACPVVFKDPSFHPPIVLPTQQALPGFVFGVLLALIPFIQTIVFMRPENVLLRRRIIRAIRRRPDAVLNPEAESSYFVDIIPRAHWNRLMLENASDIGFVTVDSSRREVLFEGDRERYRIPADAIQSCALQKSVVSKAATAEAPGTWIVVVRANRDGRMWEAPFAIRSTGGRAILKKPSKLTNALYERIHSLVPAAVNVDSTASVEESRR